MNKRRWARLLIGGVTASGVAAATGLTVQRRRAVNRLAASGEDLALGSLHSDVITVVADDGVPLAVEIEEPDEPDPMSPTIVYMHGWVLNLDCWHYQRAAFSGSYRMVFYDQRAHGRSGRGAPESCTVEQLGRDLAAVIEHIVPEGPIVLVGHSMGGMTIMAYAEQFPDQMQDRVRAVALLGTSSGDLGKMLRGQRGEALRQASPTLLTAMGRASSVVELGRRFSGPLGYELTRRLAFGSEVPVEIVAFVDAMIAANPTDVFTEFYPMFVSFDKANVLKAFHDLPTLVAVGDRDALTPVRHSRRLAEEIPTARLEVLAGAGHMLIMEDHDELNRLLRWLFVKADEQAFS